MQSEKVEEIQRLKAKAVMSVTAAVICMGCVSINLNLPSRNRTLLCKTLTPKEIREDVKNGHSQQVKF